MLQDIFRSSGPRVKMSKCFVGGRRPAGTGNSGIVFMVQPDVLKQPLLVPGPNGEFAFADGPVIKLVARRATL